MGNTRRATRRRYAHGNWNRGIFLGCVFIGLIVLYGYTKDRWRWKRIAAWFGGALLLIAVNFGGWIGYMKYTAGDFGGPKALNEFWDLSVGMPQSEVLFRKGEPKHKDKGERGEIWTYYAGGIDPVF